MAVERIIGAFLDERDAKKGMDSLETTEKE